MIPAWRSGGDYNLRLLHQLQDAGELKWIGATGELTASYAADGYARLTACLGMHYTRPWHVT